MKKRILTIVLSLGFIMGLFQCFNSIHANEKLKPVTLTWTAGGMGGGWYTQAGGISRLIASKEPKIIIKTVPGGGVVNPVRISKGRNDLGWGITFVDKMAISGTPPMYKTPNPNIRSLGGIFGKYQIHFLADSKKGLQKVGQLVNLVKNGESIKIALPQRNVSDVNVTEYILDYYGISLKAIKKAGGKVFHASYSDMVNLYKDYHVDFAVTMQSSPSAAMTEMTLSRKSTILSVSHDCIDKLHKKVGTLSLDSGFAFIPKGVYEGLERDVPTVVSASELIINKNIPDIIAYNIIKILSENVDELHKTLPATRPFIPSKAWKNVALPLHPGAVKFYKEAGYMD